MSRARGGSHAYVVATDRAAAEGRLAWEWGQERRQSWALDRYRDLPLSQLYAERRRLARSVPPDRSAELAQARDNLARSAQDLGDLYNGAGRWSGHPAGEAARAVRHAARSYEQAQARLDGGGLGLLARRRARHELSDAAAGWERAEQAWREQGEPYARALDTNRQRLDTEVAQLAGAQQTRVDFLAQHPDVPDRLASLERDIKAPAELETSLQWRRLVALERQRHMSRALGHGIDLGADIGIDL